MRVLITRPDPDNERTGEALRALGHDPVLAPVLRVQPVSDAELGSGPWSAVVMTSGNAARAIATHSRRQEIRAVPAFTVGYRSGEAAREVGFAHVESADGDVDALGRLVAEKVVDHRRPLLYLAGQDRSGDLTGILGSVGLAVLTAVVYRTVPCPVLQAVARVGLEDGSIDAAMHFSRRSAVTLLDLAAAAAVGDRTLALRHYCLSRQVGEPLVEAGAKDVFCASGPTENSLLNLIGPA
jgi:uroporphyrinogen-III synthase